MKYNERIEATFKYNGRKAELVRMIRKEDHSIYYFIRENRKVTYKTTEYLIAKKYFANTCSNILLQLQIFTEYEKKTIGELVILDYSKIYGRIKQTFMAN